MFAIAVPVEVWRDVAELATWSAWVTLIGGERGSHLCMSSGLREDGQTEQPKARTLINSNSRKPSKGR